MRTKPSSSPPASAIVVPAPQRASHNAPASRERKHRDDAANDDRTEPREKRTPLGLLRHAMSRSAVGSWQYGRESRVESQGVESRESRVKSQKISLALDSRLSDSRLSSHRGDTAFDARSAPPRRAGPDSAHRRPRGGRRRRIARRSRFTSSDERLRKLTFVSCGPSSKKQQRRFDARHAEQAIDDVLRVGRLPRRRRASLLA